MNIEKDLRKDGIIVTEKIDTETILKITNSVSKKIVNTFPNLNLNKNEIFSKLFSLNMYKAQMPDGMAEANYCYKNSSIYFNNHIANDDLEEFAIHECLHFLQQITDENNKIIKMGLSDYKKIRPIGIGLNEAAVQYISSKIINIKPDYEKYYDINLYTPSPSYYPIECALLNELLFFISDNILFKSTLFSTNDFKNEIIKYTDKKTYHRIVNAFDNILKYEEKLIFYNNKNINSKNFTNYNNILVKYKLKIKKTFFQTQNLIIQNFFDYKFKNIQNLEQLERLRRDLINIEKILGSSCKYEFYSNYVLEMMNRLEHKSNILENGGIETAIQKKLPSIFNIFSNFKFTTYNTKLSKK